jgi:hypothetical protein
LQNPNGEEIHFVHQDVLEYDHNWWFHDGGLDEKGVCSDSLTIIGWELGDI